MENIVPKLRFPEFEGNWKKKKTIDIAPLQRGFDLPTSDVKEGNYPVVYSNGILRYHNVFKVKAPGVVTGRSGTIGKVTFVEDDYWPHNTSLWVTDFKNNNPKFIFYFYSIFNLDKYNAGSTVPTLNRNDVHSIKKIIPQLDEQQKIASFLTSVDERLTLLAQQKEKLELYKKGVMQQIFSQKLRFKDENGKNYLDWEEKKLGELCEYKNGGSFESQVDKNGFYNLISLNSIDIKGKLKSEHKKVKVTDNSLKKGDLVMVLSDVAHGNFLGLTDVIPDDNYVLNQRMGALKPIVEINNYFLKTFINFNQKYFKLMGQGSSQQNLSKGDIVNFIIDLPCLEEQQKIASFLSAIDVQIDGVSKKIEQTKMFKKGLLQQMFV